MSKAVILVLAIALMMASGFRTSPGHSPERGMAMGTKLTNEPVMTESQRPLKSDRLNLPLT